MSVMQNPGVLSSFSPTLLNHFQTHIIHCFQLVSYLKHMFQPSTAIIMYVHMHEVVALVHLYISDKIFDQIVGKIVSFVTTDKTISKDWRVFRKENVFKATYK